MGFIEDIREALAWMAEKGYEQHTDGTITERSTGRKVTGAWMLAHYISSQEDKRREKRREKQGDHYDTRRGAV